LESKYRRGLEVPKSPPYSKLNMEGILAPPILFGFVASKLALKGFGNPSLVSRARGFLLPVVDFFLFFYRQLLFQTFVYNSGHIRYVGLVYYY
jgi:hypothetical protein